MRTIKFAALLFASAAALAFSNALPVQSLPQWETLKGLEGSTLMYDLNSLRSLPDGSKQIDIYSPDLKHGLPMYVSCDRWRQKTTLNTEWKMIPPDTIVEAIAYTACGRS